jgi:hypothetical protein
MSDDVRFTAKLKGGSDVARLLNRYPDKVGRTLESLVKQEARGLAVELARNTRLFGFSEKAKKRGEKAVAGDILKVFATPDQAYETAKAADSTQADRFWAHIQNRRFARAKQALAASPSKWRNLDVGRLDPKLHQQSRTGPQANVTRKEPAQVVTSRKALDTYIARIQRRVGFAKGVWINAAKAIGGRVRGAAMDDAAPQGTGQRDREDRRQACRVPRQPPRLHGRRDDLDRDPACPGQRGGTAPEGTGHLAAQGE